MRMCPGVGVLLLLVGVACSYPNYFLGKGIFSTFSVIFPGTTIPLGTITLAKAIENMQATDIILGLKAGPFVY
jgi:hypothetical protein